MNKQIPRSIVTLIGMLADNIDQKVPFEFWDEATEILINKLREKADKKFQIPASVFYNAELRLKIEQNEIGKRYLARVNGS